MEIGNEVKNFVKVWIIIFVSLSYCYAIVSKVQKGTKRLILTLPIVSLFLLLPLKLTTINLGVATSFFITWLCSFKLLLFSAGKGPLCPSAVGPPIPFSQFIAVSCLPIELKQNPLPKTPKQLPKTPLKFPIKMLTLATLLHLFNLNKSHNYFNHKLMSLLHCPLLYLLVETILAGLSTLARALLKAELEPQFDEPYMSTSLEDFWFRRYELSVSHIMCMTVQDPIFTLWAKFMGRRWAFIPAIIGSFLVNGLIHELIFFYVVRSGPTWEVTCFFLIHGLILPVEIWLKQILADTWRMPWGLSVALTNGFLVLTTAWLFFPPLLRHGFEGRLLGEYQALFAFLKSIIV